MMRSCNVMKAMAIKQTQVLCTLGLCEALIEDRFSHLCHMLHNSFLSTSFNEVLERCMYPI